MMIDTVDSYVDYIDEETWQQLVASLLYAHRAEIISQRCVKRACVKQLLYSFATSAVCRAAQQEKKSLRDAASQRFRNL